MQITRQQLPTFARATPPQQEPAPAPTPEPAPQPPAEDGPGAERYVRAGIYALNGVACIALGRAAVANNGPVNLFCGAMTGASGGAGYGHVGDIFANIMNIGTFEKRYETPGMLVGSALGAGAAYLASGNPVVGYALGVGCALPSFLSSYRALKGLE